MTTQQAEAEARRLDALIRELDSDIACTNGVAREVAIRLRAMYREQRAELPVPPVTVYRHFGAQSPEFLSMLDAAAAIRVS